MTNILTCTCTHAFQNDRYGPFQRVHNYAPKSNAGSKKAWRCTVCGKINFAGEMQLTTV